MSQQPDSAAYSFETWRESQRAIDRIRALESEVRCHMRMNLKLTKEVRLLRAELDTLKEQENA